MFNWWGGPVSKHALNTGGQKLPRRTSAKPLVGYRSWLVTDLPALKSIHMGYVWAVDNTAACLIRHSHTEPAPFEKCACGLYAQLPEQPLSEWENMTQGRVHATGTVALSGRVIRCQYGFKAQYAEIQSPVVVELPCDASKRWEPCVGEIVQVSPANVSRGYPLAYCESHLPDEELVDAGPWVSGLLEGLGGKYPGVEFLSFLGDW